jgi:3-hydroxybutyrate dehydrogenase
MNRLDNYVALITGAASGIGREIALAFSRAGAHVVIADLNKAADTVVAEISKTGGSALGGAIDVSDEDAVNMGVAAAVEAYGKIDALVSNAVMVGLWNRRSASLQVLSPQGRCRC